MSAGKSNAFGTDLPDLLGFQQIKKTNASIIEQCANSKHRESESSNSKEKLFHFVY